MFASPLGIPIWSDKHLVLFLIVSTVWSFWFQNGFWMFKKIRIIPSYWYHLAYFSLPVAKHGRGYFRNCSNRVIDIPNVGFYSLPKIMGRTGRFIYDGLRLISLGSKQKQKNTNIVQKPNAVLVAVHHFPPSPYSTPVGSSGNKSLHWG